MSRFLSLFLLFACWFQAVAELRFDSLEKIHKAEAGEASYATTFKFTNVGKKDITITDIKSSCVCTVAELQKRDYKPGESGEISAKIVYGINKGRYVKKIYVTAKDDRAKTITLSIGAIIPEFARVTPRFLRWAHDDPKTAKTIQVQVIHNEPIKVIKVSSSNPSWSPKLTVVKEGWEYTISVEPPAMGQASRTALSIEMDYPENQHLVFRAVARVTQPPEPVKVESWLEKLLK